MNLYTTDSYKRVHKSVHDASFDIILGIFNTTPFNTVKAITGARDYGFSLSYNPNFKSIETGVINQVHQACVLCNDIHFVLDGIRLPLSFDSITCRELDFLFRYPEFFKKTIFWLGGKQLVNDDVLDILLKIRTDELTFNNIAFDKAIQKKKLRKIVGGLKK